MTGGWVGSGLTARIIEDFHCLHTPVIGCQDYIHILQKQETLIKKRQWKAYSINNVYLPSNPIHGAWCLLFFSNVAFVTKSKNDIKTVRREIVSIQLLCQDTLVLAGPSSPSFPDVFATSTV